MLPRISLSGLSRLAGALAMTMGFVVLVGWHFDIVALTSILPNLPSMKANTALAFVLAGLALLMLRRPRAAAAGIARACGVLIATAGFLTLSQYFFGWNLGIDEILYRDQAAPFATSEPGRMAPTTALSWILLGIALFGLSYERLRTTILVEFATVFTSAISLLGLFGYATGLVELTGPGAYTKMAVHTAVGLCILCAGAFSAAYAGKRLQITIEQKLLAGLTAAAAIIIFISFLSVSGILSLVQSGARVEHTQMVKQRLARVLSHVVDDETRARGFVLSGDESFAAPAPAARRELLAILQDLGLQTGDNPAQTEALSRLGRLVELRIRFSDAMIESRRAGGLEPAAALFKTGGGEATTDSIRAIIAAMQREEDRLLLERRGAEREEADRTQAVIYLSLALQMVFLAVIFVVVSRDATGRRMAEEETRRTKDLLDSIIENIPAMIFLKDAADLRFARFNKAGEELLGRPRAELMGKNDYDFFPKEQADFFTTKDREVLSGDGILDIPEEPIQTRNKGERVLHTRKIPLRDERGELMYLLGISEDITDRKRAEEALRDSERRLALALESGQMGAWDLDLVRDTSVRSLRHDQIFGYDEILPSWGAEIFLRHVLPDDRAGVQEKFGIAFASGTLAFECRIRRPDDAVRWIAAQGRAYYDPQGKPVRMMGVVSDITDRKDAELSLQQLNVQLAAANRELEAFSYSVSHDLRAPLRSIDGFSQALLEDYAASLDDRGKDFLRRVRDASQRMGHLIDDILDLARVSRAEMRRESIDLSQIAAAAAAELQRAHPNRSVEVRIAERLATYGDARLLRVLMDNLLGNAWKYTGKHETALIEVGVSNDGSQVFFVRDDGAGFDMAYADRLFGAFQRLHAVTDFPGTGIGLATVQRIVHRHGGRVWAEGKVEAGATVYFTLS